jgi:hypothetical protein
MVFCVEGVELVALFVSSMKCAKRAMLAIINVAPHA